MDTKRTVAIVNCKTDLMVTPDLLFWLQEIGIDRTRIAFHRVGARDTAVNYNHGLRLALESFRAYNHFIFADADIRPHPGRTAAFLDGGDDGLVSCQYPCHCAGAWSEPTSFHCGLWRATRQTLVRFEMPAFRWLTDRAGTVITGCVCQAFAQKALAMGLPVRWAGQAGHVPRAEDGLPDVVRFARRADDGR